LKFSLAKNNYSYNCCNDDYYDDDYNNDDDGYSDDVDNIDTYVDDDVDESKIYFKNWNIDEASTVST